MTPTAKDLERARVIVSVDYAFHGSTKLLLGDIAAALADERGRAAKILLDEVKRHRAQQRLIADDVLDVCPESFCEDYGCVSLERFAAAILQGDST